MSTMGYYPDLLELRLIVLDEDGDTESVLQEDDGVSHDYSSGAFLRTTFVVSRRGLRVTVILRTSGDGFPEFRRTQFRIVLDGFTGDRVELNGTTIGVQNAQFYCENRGESASFSFTL